MDHTPATAQKQAKPAQQRATPARTAATTTTTTATVGTAVRGVGSSPSDGINFPLQHSIIGGLEFSLVNAIVGPISVRSSSPVATHCYSPSHRQPFLLGVVAAANSAVSYSPHNNHSRLPPGQISGPGQITRPGQISGPGQIIRS